MKVVTLPASNNWFRSLKDRQIKFRISDRLARLSEGLFGDCHPVGNGVSELRFHFGTGYRVYFTIRKEVVIVLLIGGDKSSQNRDIVKAQELSKEIP